MSKQTIEIQEQVKEIKNLQGLNDANSDLKKQCVDLESSIAGKDLEIQKLMRQQLQLETKINNKA